GAVEPDSVQRVRARRGGLDRRRAGIRPQRPGAAAEVRLHAGTARHGGYAMSSFRLNILLGAVLAVAAPVSSQAQDFLVRHAKVHTADARGTIADGDVRVKGGRIAEVGSGLAPGAGETVIEAKGRPLTPGLFAGATGLGVEEVSQ